MKSIIVLLSVLTLSGCVAVPDYSGIDIQPSVIYPQPYYYNPIVINRYPGCGYRNYNYYRNHRPYGHGNRYNNRGYGPRYNLNQNNGNTSSRNTPRPHSQSRKLYQ